MYDLVGDLIELEDRSRSIMYSSHQYPQQQLENANHLLKQSIESMQDDKFGELKRKLGYMENHSANSSGPAADGMPSTPKQSKTTFINENNLDDSAAKNNDSTLHADTTRMHAVATHAFQCDFCDYVDPQACETMQHLKEKMHYSATLTKRLDKINQYQKERPVNEEIYRPKTRLTNKEARNFNTVIMCPVCNEVFDNCELCGFHCVKEHGSISAQYCVCPVTQRKEVAVSVSKRYVCSECGATFERLAQLKSHFKVHNSPDVPEDTMRVFRCNTCCYVFTGSFWQCRQHVFRHKTKDEQNITIMLVKISSKAKVLHEVDDGILKLPDYHIRMLTMLKRHKKIKGVSKRVLAAEVGKELKAYKHWHSNS